MKRTPVSTARRSPWGHAVLITLAAAQSACSGAVSPDESQGTTRREADGGTPGALETGSAADAPSASPSGGSEPAPSNDTAAPDEEPNVSPPATAPSGGDATSPPPSTLRRLSNREYDNTVRDLLGTRLNLAKGFLKETAHGFDNVSNTLGMTVAQYNTYFGAATTLAEAVFSDPQLSATFAACDATPNSECVERLLADFGLRVFRRPLLPDEIETYRAVYDRATALGLSHSQALQEMVRAQLASAEFLYRTETAAGPADAQNADEPTPVSGYELASRLSYFLGSTMPDAALFEAAETGKLSSQEEVRSHVTRLLSAPGAQTLVNSFAWQWLGMESLESHAVLSDVFPEWDETLRTAMLGEANEYLSHFVLGDADWRDFLTADLHFVNRRLAEHYGVPDDTLADEHFSAHEGDTTSRLGFMGTASFLTVSSFAHRTSPTLRAKWLLEALWCSPPPPPPPNLMVPDLDAQEAANQAASLDNVRERLELHRSDPSCAGCHNTLDPLGLALEHFDAVGRYRAEYSDGSPVDAAGELPNGTQLDGLPALAELFAEDDRFLSCTTQKIFTYAMGRAPTTADTATLTSLNDQWQAGALTFPKLVEHLCTSPFFTLRPPASSQP